MGARKQFSPEFKREAVQLLESGSRPASELARELGIPRNRLYKWQTEVRARGAVAFPGAGVRQTRTSEIARLKRELARVTEERDILKKPRRTLPGNLGEVRVYAEASAGVSGDVHVSGASGKSEWVLWLVPAQAECPDTGEPGPHRTDPRPASADP